MNGFLHSVRLLVKQDERISLAIYERVQTMRGLVRFTRIVGRYGAHLFFVEMFVCIVYTSIFAQPLALRAVQSVLSAIASALLCKVIIDSLAGKIQRIRPFVTFRVIPVIAKDASDPSFPSNHAGGAFALAVTLSIWFPALAFISYTLALCLAFARVAAGLHYVLDVVAGAVIGGVLALLVNVVVLHV